MQKIQDSINRILGAVAGDSRKLTVRAELNSLVKAVSEEAAGRAICDWEAMNTNPLAFALAGHGFRLDPHSRGPLDSPYVAYVRQGNKFQDVLTADGDPLESDQCILGRRYHGDEEYRVIGTGSLSAVLAADPGQA